MAMAKAKGTAKTKVNRGRSQRGGTARGSSGRNPASGFKLIGSKRSREGFRWVVGLHACREVLAVRPQSIVKVLAKKNSEGEALVRECKSLDVDVRWVEDHELAKFARTHQGIAMEVDGAPVVDWESVYNKQNSIVLILDEIVDPHNLGAIMRTAWLMGCDAVVTSQNRSAGLTPAVAKVACGAVEHVPLVVESQLPAIMQRLKANGFWTLGLAFSASNLLWQQDLKGKVCWVVGSEEKGIRKPVEKECDSLVGIPQLSASASYNASVATAIALAETCRQQNLDI